MAGNPKDTAPTKGAAAPDPNALAHAEEHPVRVAVAPAEGPQPREDRVVAGELGLELGHRVDVRAGAIRVDVVLRLRQAIGARGEEGALDLARPGDRLEQARRPRDRLEHGGGALDGAVSELGAEGHARTVAKSGGTLGVRAARRIGRQQPGSRSCWAR